MNYQIKALLLCFIFIFSTLTLAEEANDTSSISNSFISSKSNSINILYVGGSGPGNYSNIQDAMDNASDGDTVFVYNGTYYENIIVKKSITVIGEDRNTTLIDGSRIGDVVNITAEKVIINSFTIKNSELNRSTGIRLLSDGITIKNNIISNNYNGIFNGYVDYEWPWGYYPHDNNIIQNNIIRYNLMDGIQTGGYNNTITENLITTNEYYGIEISNFISTHDPTKPEHHVCNNTITRNGNSSLGSGIVISWGASNNLIENNIIQDNRDFGVGIMAFYSSNYYDRNNTVKNNYISGGHKGILIYESRFNTISENHISNNTYSILCFNYDAQNNIIFHNNIFDCEDFHAEDIGENVWNLEYPLGGNYWDDYNGTDNFHGPNQDIPGGDGIGDTPYAIIGGDNQDRYPLIFPYGTDEVPPILNITKPGNALYLRNKNIIPLHKPLIIGILDIEAESKDYQSGIDKVEFYIDDELKETDISEPYSWMWDERALLRFRHTIKVIAYDNAGNSNLEELFVRKFI